MTDAPSGPKVYELTAADVETLGRGILILPQPCDQVQIDLTRAPAWVRDAVNAGHVVQVDSSTLAYCPPGRRVGVITPSPASGATAEDPAPVERPTPGRIVYLYPLARPDHPPVPAIVALVPPDAVLGSTAIAVKPQTVPGSVDPAHEPIPTVVPHKTEAADPDSWYWDWMPYQKGQAKKVEEVAERRMGMVRVPTTHELANRFTYHAPKPGQPQRYQAIRDHAHELAGIMCACCPPSDELARALDHLDNAVFNANAAIARHE